MKYTNEEFANQRVELDGNQYLNCRFLNCILVYKGTGNVGFDDCFFDNPRIVFEDCAASALNFLQAMYNSPLRDLVEVTLKGDVPPLTGTSATYH